MKEMSRMISTNQCLISFDFDDTLAESCSIGWGGTMLVCIPEYLQLLREYHALGCKCIILTARTPKMEHISEINEFMKRYEIDELIADIVFTSHEPKGPIANAMGVHLHYDDSDRHLESVRSYGIFAVSTKKIA